MGPFEFVITLVVIYVVADLLRKVVKEKANVGGRYKQQELEQLLASVAGLEQRMRVVEEIVSSKSFDLRQQIDELQGEQL